MQSNHVVPHCITILKSSSRTTKLSPLLSISVKWGFDGRLVLQGRVRGCGSEVAGVAVFFSVMLVLMGCVGLH